MGQFDDPQRGRAAAPPSSHPISSRCIDRDDARTHPAAATLASMRVPYTHAKTRKAGFAFPPADMLTMKHRFFLSVYATPGILLPGTAGPDGREGCGKGDVRTRGVRRCS